MTSPLDHVLFISLPENLSLQGLPKDLDPRILLPVDTTPLSPEEWKLTDLRWESLETGLLKVLAWDNQRDEAAYYVKILKQMHPGIAQELLQMAIAKTRNKDFELARELFLCIRTLEPKNATSYLNTAVFYEAYGRHCESLGRNEESLEYYQLAEEDFKKTLEGASVPPEAYYLSGLFHYSRGNYSYSTSLLNNYLDLADKNDSRRSRALEAIQTIRGLQQEKELYQQAFEDIEADRNDEGIQKILQFLKAAPGSWNGWFLLGWGERKNQQWDKALTAFQKAAEINREVPDLLNEMAICNMEQQQFDDAKTLLEEAYQLNSRDIRIISNLAILALKSEKIDEAIQWFEEVLHIEPDDEMALQYLDYISKGL